MKKIKRFKHITSCMLVLLLAIPFSAMSQPIEESMAAQTSEKFFKPEELEQMLAPIALYPDALLAQVFTAATYPLEVVEADRFVKENQGLKGEALLEAAKDMDWEPSVKAMLEFPDVLAMMDEQLEWTKKLGDAFLAQQSDCMDAVQRLRQKAYEQGNLVARCYDNGKETASQSLKTVGIPASIRLTADRYPVRANRNDLAYITAELVDADGNVIPYADDVLVKFDISGQGKLAATGNGNPKDMASFQQPERKFYQGVCLAIVHPATTKGKIYIKATSEGLKECNLEVSVK